MEGWVKINTDGMFKANIKLAGCEGLIRNQWGGWMGGFTHKLGSCSITDVECWGILNGLQLAWEIGCRKVILEADSLCAINSLNNTKSLPSKQRNLTTKCEDLLSREWSINFNHTYREANKFLSQDLSYIHLERAPKDLNLILFHDVTGDYPKDLCSCFVLLLGFSTYQLPKKKKNCTALWKEMLKFKSVTFD